MHSGESAARAHLLRVSCTETPRRSETRSGRSSRTETSRSERLDVFDVYDV